MLPWRPFLVFNVIAVGTTTAIALLMTWLGWTVNSPGWGLLVPIAMWAPAVARYTAQRTEHRRFTGTLLLGRWGITGAQVVLVPLAMPIAVYGVAYAISQWLFPKLFAVSDDQPWLRGEAGILPMAGYIVLGAALFIWMRMRGSSWAALAGAALTAHPEERRNHPAYS